MILSNSKLFILIFTLPILFQNQNVTYPENHGHHGATYEVTSPLKNKTIGNYIYLNVVDEKTNEAVPARFSLVINHKRFIPDSLDENGIRFTSIHKGKNEIFTVTYTRGAGPVFIPLPENARDGIIYCTKGYEYVSTETNFKIQKGDSIRIKMRQWANLKKEGWLSADEHLHYDRLKKEYDKDWLTMLEADDLAHSHFLVLKGGNLPHIWASQYAYGEEGEATNGRSAIYPGEEYRDSKQGHLNLLGVKEIIYPILADTDDHPYNHPSFHSILKKTHELGGIGGPAHGTKHGQMPTGMLDVVLGVADFFEILNTGINKLDVWYKLMNCGFFIPPAAGTDLPNWPYRDRWQPFFGETRMYVKMENGSTDFQSWKNAVKDGKVFVSSGPIIKFKINNIEIGDTLNTKGNEPLEIKAELLSTQPLQHLEIVQNGKVIFKNTNWEKVDGIYKIKIQESINITKSSWFAARGEGYRKQALYFYRGDKQNIFSHTAPIQVLLNNQPIILKEYAQKLIEDFKVQKKFYQLNGNFKKEEHRKLMTDLFDHAIEIVSNKMDR